MYNQSEYQPESYFNEQNLSIDLCTRTIDYYADLSSIFTKSAGINGFPGSGKTWCMKHCMVYELSKGLCVSATAQMARYYIQFGGKHWHCIFFIPV